MCCLAGMGVAKAQNYKKETLSRPPKGGRNRAAREW